MSPRNADHILIVDDDREIRELLSAYLDGALPDDMRRGGSFQWPPEYTQYPREALSGYVALAEILFRQGYDVYEWEDQALLRAARFLYDLEQQFPDEEWWERFTADFPS